ncbi:MAG: FecR domain-containing protein [Gemmatimonadales bacterium]|nr:FecR domain-containing protein [Gemmatimonadales bacterium]
MSDLDWELFDHYLAGVATPAERETFERWLADGPDHPGLLLALGGALAALEADVPEEEREAVWEGVAERTGLGSPESGRFTVAEPPRARRRFGAGLAAAALLTAGAVVAGRELLSEGDQPELASERVVTVPLGERARFHLPDGTEVLLGAGSTLRHPSAFTGRMHEVTLEGEAYFTVKHDENRAFRVRARDLIATDLGTEFLVRAYPESMGARVVVRSGTVAVRAVQASDSTQPGRVVRAGEVGRITAEGVPLVERADTAAYFAWTTGTLVFDATPLRDALPQLSRWYDLEFRLADSALGTIPLSGRLDQTITPARLDLLAGSVGLEQARKGRVVTFHRPGGAPR